MNNCSIRKVLSFIGCVVLIAALALMVGCGSKESRQTPEVPKDGITFVLTVEDLDGTKTEHTITSAAGTVGEALLEDGIVKGENGPYGLYVKEVNGIVADWDTDGTYWAFYIDGEYAVTGVDTIELLPDKAYAFVRTTG